MPLKTLDLDKPKSTPKSSQSSSPTAKTNGFKIWLRRYRWWLIGGFGCLLIVAGLVTWLIWSQSNSAPTPEPVAKSTPTPTPEVPSIPNPLNGVLYTKAEAAVHENRRPLAVMVENHVEARPQSGLSEAEVIYEAMAEGGITRFMAMYLHNDAAKIGPIRSARQHYVDWAAEYDAGYVHWGGSAGALDYLRNNSRPHDIDQFYNAGAFYRDFSGGKSLEHTGFSSTENLRQVVSTKGWQEMPIFRPWTFKDDLAQPERPQSQVVLLDFLNANYYKAGFDYRPETNDYLRTTAGQPHLDDQGQQLVAKTIVLQLQNVVQYTDDAGHPAVEVATIGSGRAVIIQDGTAIEGQWSKTAANVRTAFTDQSGKDIPLNRGLIWVISVPTGSNYSY